ncbi:MAG: serine/threonine protein kinase [Microcystis sp. M54BS1]|uniref:serine/threonine protein kinase n=1 Tax=unclassified Microcystis TaxID=2643300 RepID=UPI00257C9CAC|nr:MULTISPECIES: serine/threonine-protein kinase [unclassified Microcystis]MCA2541361.1 serine/threonine protein kinase [Microcystis sp. M54BS1]MCA2596141.1 serine/threonine protein kinase [Microcystis sp. M38BS1]MCA2610480.1 serine/threonine protein kinase [Microcystis sp. M27BS1]MCA2506715.1 serine/threonine protein kinase [Microcystis sp. M62BS1]MCA2509251.1 serine/threonine protein kinase [Microcystis sp. M60BS1]
MENNYYHTNLPNFQDYGYQVVRELGINSLGGRITYQAIMTSTQTPVVIKQFRFCTSNANWTEYRAIEREIDVLKQLNHPQIPRYLDHFDSGNGLCLVQEFKNAQPLSNPRSYNPEQIKKIAIQLLNILIYLQDKTGYPEPIYHRDIKPDNILLDDQLKVYLIDFGLAEMGNREVNNSSIFAGTPIFIAPEQFLRKRLTKASDLYGLGLTLICLVTGITSDKISELQDQYNDCKIRFKHLVPKLSLQFISWLEKMVERNVKKRFQNAQEALEALKPLYLIRSPIVQLSASELELTANEINENITSSITVINEIPDTILQGEWSIGSHENDVDSRNSHPWITITPDAFEGNHHEFSVTVDTSHLMADKIYERELILISNTDQKSKKLKLIVNTAPLPIEKVKHPPYLLLASVLLWFVFCVKVPLANDILKTITSEELLIPFKSDIDVINIYAIAFTSGSIGAFLPLFKTWKSKLFFLPFLSYFVFWLTYIIVIIVVIVSFMVFISNQEIPLWIYLLVGYRHVIILVLLTFGWLFLEVGIFPFIGGLLGELYTLVMIVAASNFDEGAIGFAKGTIIASITSILLYSTESKFKNKQIDKGYIFILLTIGLGIAIGAGSVVGWFNPYVLLALALTSFLLIFMILYPHINRARLVNQYRHWEKRNANKK